MAEKIQIFKCPGAGRHPMCRGCCKELRGRQWKETNETQIGGYNGPGPLGNYGSMRGACLALMGAREPGIISDLLPVIREED